MNNQVLSSGDVVYYAVKVNGTQIQKFSDKTIAENIKLQIEKDKGPSVLVEVVPVTSDGKEILFG